jgi:hypothetical protein
MTPLQGTAARNKGMALFPRKIDGKYAMIARQDNENLYLIYSDDLYTWDGGQAILKPQISLGVRPDRNCGSPIELEEGWLLLTHGVGPVRKYSIGAALLDKRDPSKVLARSSEPLLRPEPSETRRLCSQCGLYLRGDDAQRSAHFALRRIGYVLQLRNDPDFRAVASRCPEIEVARCDPRPVRSAHGSRNQLLRSGLRCRPGRKPESAERRSPARRRRARFAPRSAGLEQARGGRLFITGDPEMGDYDDEPTVIFRKGQLPSGFRVSSGSATFRRGRLLRTGHVDLLRAGSDGIASAILP